jgi:hypothetical protein
MAYKKIFTLEEAATSLGKTGAALRKMRNNKRVTPDMVDQHGRWYWESPPTCKNRLKPGPKKKAKRKNADDK